MGAEWRVEADDDWLAEHRTDTFERLRRRFRLMGMVAGAVSHAETGPFGGAPRKPALKIGGRTYAVVRYTRHHIAYTAIRVDPDHCRRCGQPLVEVHRIVYARGDDAPTPIATVRTCRRCHAGSWLFRSGMPVTARARTRARKVVL
jgi:hypothetical protein